MIEHSPTIAEFVKGLHGAQGLLKGVVKDRKNPHFKNNYATLEAVLDTARPALQANGLAVTQAPGRMLDGCIEITTMLMHTSGEWMRATLHVPLVKRDPQGLGSATTYGLRYALMAALGVPPTDDDDGEAAAPDRGDRTVSQRAADSARPNGTQRANGSSAIAVTSGNRAHRTVSQQIADKMCAALWRAKGQDEVEGITDDERFQRDLKVLDREDRQRVQALIDERKMIAPDGSTVHDEREGARH